MFPSNLIFYSHKRIDMRTYFSLVNNTLFIIVKYCLYGIQHVLNGAYMAQHYSISFNLLSFHFLCFIIGFNDLEFFGNFKISICTAVLKNYCVIKNLRKNHPILLNCSKILKNKSMSMIFLSLLLLLLACDNKRQKDYTILINNETIWYKNSRPPHLFIKDNKQMCMVGFGCESENIYQGRSYENMNITIAECSFSRSLAFSDDGGVINVHGGSYWMNVTNSMFFNCLSTQSGGAIYFYSSFSYLKMVCANRCRAMVCHFSIITASKVNYVEFISTSFCSNTTLGSYSIRIQNGNQSLDNSNISMNNAEMVSGILIQSPSSFKSIHCAFSNNKVSYNRCISICSTSTTITISSYNVVHNNSPSGSGVVHHFGGGLSKMTYCLLQYNSNHLFCVDSGFLEVSNSYLDHLQLSFSTSTVVSTLSNNSFTKYMTYQIQFFNAFHCHADFPLIEQTKMNTVDLSPLRTIEDTFRKSPNNTPYRSYAQMICTNHLIKKRGISVIFSFSFLYPAIILIMA